MQSHEKEPALGSLTGVRPTKMLMQKLEEGVPDDRILDWITKEHFVSGEKAKLGLDIAKGKPFLKDGE